MLGYNRLGINGRLGNQMFQYASMRGIAAMKGFDWVVPPEDYDHTANYALFETFKMTNVQDKNIGFVNGQMLKETIHCYNQNLVDEYEKYVYDMLEQGLEPMSFEQFRSMALAGEAKAPTEEVEEEIKEKKVITLAQGGIASLTGA